MSLHVAILKGDFALARHFVESGVGVNERDGEGRTPLMLCSLHDGESWALGVARMLLAHGGRVGLGDGCGRSALTFAVLYKRHALLRLLLQALDYDLRRPDCDCHNALWYAVQSGDDAILRAVLQKFKRFGYEKTSELRMVKPIKGQSTVKGLSLSNCKTDKLVYNKQSKEDEHMKPQSRAKLPYKTLPANLWTTKQMVHRARGLCPNRGSNPAIPSQKGEGKVSEENGSVCPQPVKDWRLSVRKLTELLQEQLSSSYRPRAQPLPKPTRPRRRLSRVGRGSVLEPSLRQRRQRGRKMSLGAIDDALKMESQRKGEFRRRSSVAVIPMSRQQAAYRRPSMPLLENIKLAREVKAPPKLTGKKENAKKKT